MRSSNAIVVGVCRILLGAAVAVATACSGNVIGLPEGPGGSAGAGGSTTVGPAGPHTNTVGVGPQTTVGVGPETTVGVGPQTSVGVGPQTSVGVGPQTTVSTSVGPQTSVGVGPQTTVSTSVGPQTSATSTGGGGSCDNSGSCDNCQSCAWVGSCDAEAQTCVATPECEALINCYGTCAANDQACWDQCYAAHPQGHMAYNAVAICILCDACYHDCDSSGDGCPTPP